MFNQRVSKLDLLKRRQSYSEFEELIEKKVSNSLNPDISVAQETFKLHKNHINSIGTFYNFNVNTFREN